MIATALTSHTLFVARTSKMLTKRISTGLRANLKRLLTGPHVVFIFKAQMKGMSRNNSRMKEEFNCSKSWTS